MIQERYLVKSTGDNQSGAEAGLIKALELLGKHKAAMIVVPTIGNFKHSMLTKVLLPEHAKLLLKERKITFSDGTTIGLCAQSQLKNHRNIDVFLDMWGTQYSIADIESMFGWKAVVLVTWGPTDSKEWEAKYPVSIIFDDSGVS
ncbi:hypothetical protein HSX11_17915 [Oxalobacteraceae bacterium]|nr:hypothetical protein [Oxalobacteraceae bacterium]